MNRKDQRALEIVAARIGSLLTAAVITQATLSAASHRIYLSPTAAPPAMEITGNTEIVITPAQEPASVTLAVDGAQVGRKSTPPYTFSVDFGTHPIERKLSVTVRTPKGRTQWSRVINSGHHPLSITLESGEEPGLFRAVTTAPQDDPIAEVSFFAGDQQLARLTDPPFIVRNPAASDAASIFVTARTRSGAEIADSFALGEEVMTESYDVRTVPLFVTVTDDKGSTLDTLTRSDFRVYDKGKEAKILEFGKAFDQPISLVLVVDASTSMVYSMSHAAGAARRFIESVLREGDRAALFSIRSVPRREVALTNDLASVRRAIDGLAADGETALYDSVASAIRELREQQGRRAIVVLSDGDDTSSNRTFEDLASEAKESAIPIYFVAFNSEGATTPSRAADQMRYLSISTGGFLATARTDDLAKKYENIAKDLRAQYAIRYQIADASQPREWRPVKVVVNSPRLSARTISGYFAP
jgi:Ca-activated chloride channel family protein